MRTKEKPTTINKKKKKVKSAAEIEKCEFYEINVEWALIDTDRN